MPSSSCTSTRRRSMIPFSRLSRPAFLLVEVMMGIALFALFLASSGLVLLNGQEGTEMAGDRVRGSFLAQRSIEGARDIRGGGFASLVDGQHGVALGVSGKWEFLGTQTNDGDYFTSLTVSTIAADVRRLVSRAWWRHGYTRSGSVILTTELTNWRTACWTGDWSSAVLEGVYVPPGGTPFFTSGAVSSGSLFLAANNDVRIFNMATTGWATAAIGSPKALAVKGKRLYVLTAGQVSVYNVNLLPGNTTPLAQRNIAGTALSLAVAGNTLLVGTTWGGSPEILSFDISNSGAIVPLKTGDTAGGDVNAIALTGTSAYLALSDGASELALSNASGGSLNPLQTVNVAGNLPALAVARSGTGLLLGTAKDSNDRGSVWFFNLENGLPGTPTQFLASGSVLGIDLDPTGMYAFVAADSRPKALQILNIRAATPTDVGSFDLDPSKHGRGVVYDPVRDRVYLFTTHDVRVFRPGGSATRPCT